MKRSDIKSTIGGQYLRSNIEAEEFSYQKGLQEYNIDINKIRKPEWKRLYKDVDMRFVLDNLTVLVETKQNFDNEKIEDVYEQLSAYVTYEKKLTNNKIVAILANVNDDRIRVWYGDKITISDEFLDVKQTKLKSMKEYKDLYFSTDNDKIKVMQNTYKLNETLYTLGINEKIRSQFVGTCLLALKNDLVYKGLNTQQITVGLETILSKLLKNDIERAEKLAILKTKVLDSQDIRELKDKSFESVLDDIKDNILPYINDKSSMGQDLLNLFFTTFNKYVGKADKNQAFTPDHLVHFMCDVLGLNRNSRILDPCSGSGAFLVRAMTEAMADAETEEEIQEIKRKQVYGIEVEEVAFGLSTTNMLIHGDGNSNIRQGNCFEPNFAKKIEEANINIVLMNPPYNASRKESDPNYTKHWAKKTKTDPSKGFHFVHYIASKVKTGKLAVLLPMSCAIGSSNEIKKYKEKMLQEHTLDAVFSLPSDIFHPGANVTTCCMIFDLGTRHDKALRKGTFFGYFKNDGFVKKKKLGRVEQLDQYGNGNWEGIKKEWLDLYFNRKEKTGLSVIKEVTFEDEWLAEAYMETDYKQLSDFNFEYKIKDFIAFQTMTGRSEFNNYKSYPKLSLSDTDNWGKFYINKDKNYSLFKLEDPKGITTDLLEEGYEIPYIAAKSETMGMSKLVNKIGNEQFLSEGNCLTFVAIGQGSVGYSTYQSGEFIGMKGKIKLGYNNNLNKYTGLFISTLLDLERPKYSFGRSWTGNNLDETIIKLPITKQGEPDWIYMEEYIKGLTYGNIV